MLIQEYIWLLVPTNTLNFEVWHNFCGDNLKRFKHILKELLLDKDNQVYLPWI